MQACSKDPRVRPERGPQYEKHDERRDEINATCGLDSAGLHILHGGKSRNERFPVQAGDEQTRNAGKKSEDEEHWLGSASEADGYQAACEEHDNDQLRGCCSAPTCVSERPAGSTKIDRLRHRQWPGVLIAGELQLAT